jgi:hypothetical protein
VSFFFQRLGKTFDLHSSLSESGLFLEEEGYHYGCGEEKGGG